MIISERIFELLELRGMSQKEFAERTGIAQSTISDWKRKKTNPISEKILVIAQTLEVSPEELLGGVEVSGTRSREVETYTIGRETELGRLVETYQSLDKGARARVLGYMKALEDARNE